MIYGRARDANHRQLAWLRAQRVCVSEGHPMPGDFACRRTTASYVIEGGFHKEASMASRESRSTFDSSKERHFILDILSYG